MPRKTTKSTRVAAAVHIKDAPRMTAKGRAEIAAWLRRTATDFEKLGREYSPNFRARYHVPA